MSGSYISIGLGLDFILLCLFRFSILCAKQFAVSLNISKFYCPIGS